MKALVFGQSGLHRDDYMEQVKRVARKNGHQFEIINLGDEMKSIDPQRRDPQIYPSLDVSIRELLRTQALKSINAKVRKSPGKDFVLNAHAVFRLDTGLSPAADEDLLDTFDPEIVIVMVDDFQFIKRRLEQTPYRNLSNAAILEWRDAEMATAKAVADMLFGSTNRADRKFFVLLRGQDPVSAYRLLYERDRNLRIYSSFAITSATKSQHNRIAEFKRRMSRNHIVFDPYKMMERGIIASGATELEDLAERTRDETAVQRKYAQFIASLTKYSQSGSSIRFQRDFNPEEVIPAVTQISYTPPKTVFEQRDDNVGKKLLEKYSFHLQELLGLQMTIDGQILSRDYLLIDQSEVVCALVPWNEKQERAEVSAGSQSELTYARLSGCKTFIVCEGKKKSKISPWITQHATRLLSSFEELEKELKSELREKLKREKLKRKR